MSENPSEKSEMSSVEFVQYALRTRIAPPDVGQSVAERIRYAARRLGWSYSRTKDAWYADPRISIKADEVRKIEEATGARYGREELREIDAIISRADEILDSQGTSSRGALAAALRTILGALDRPGTGT